MRAPSSASVASSKANGFIAPPAAADAAGLPRATNAPAEAPAEPRREWFGSSSSGERLGTGFSPLGDRGRGLGLRRKAAEERVDERLGVALEGKALRREHPARDEARDERQRADRRLLRIHARRQL